MKKLALWMLILCCIVSFFGCADLSEGETVSFQGKTIHIADLSEETLQWLEYYNSLSESEQMAISYIPHDLYILCGYGKVTDAKVQYLFQATVLEVSEEYVLVAPAEGSSERNSADKIQVMLPDQPSWPIPQPGDRVTVAYDGMIQELYPARIPNPYRLEIIS